MLPKLIVMVVTLKHIMIIAVPRKSAVTAVGIKLIAVSVMPQHIAITAPTRVIVTLLKFNT